MTFTPSLTPDITESLPMPLSQRITADIGLYARNGAAFDIAIGGLPFFLKVDAQNPYQRQTAQWKKDQFDNSKEAGEQTLQQWWTRSQASFHKGEGINFYEPSSDELTEFRYKHAVGVDIWTEGTLSLNRAMALEATVASGDVWVESATIAATPGYYAVYGGEVHYTKDGSATVAVTRTGDPATSRPAMCGSAVVVGTDNGGLLKGTIGGSTIATFTSGLPTASGVRCTPYWVKSRIIAAVGPSLYEVPLAGSVDALTALYTHPDADWVWTYVAESPQAILAAGYSPSGRSAIFRFNLTTPTDGSTPELSQPVQAAEFPPGEEVHAIRVYLGTYLGIGTNAGLRVGIVSEEGQIQYGPILASVTEPIQCITGFGEFIVAGVTNAIDGKSGSVRVNLAEPVDNLRFAWSWDVQTQQTGEVQSIGFVHTQRGDDQQYDVVLGVADRGVYRQTGSFEATGYLLTGKVRYATTERKLFRLLGVDARPNSGTIVLSTVGDTGGESSLATIGDDRSSDDDILISSLDTPQKYAQLRVTLNASSDLSASPTLTSWTLKAIPVVARQRLIRYPLICSDSHTDVNGVKVGVKGWAWTTMAALEEVESRQAILPVQDFRTGETFAASIESVDFAGVAPPARHDPAFRGVLSVVVRKL